MKVVKMLQLTANKPSVTGENVLIPIRVTEYFKEEVDKFVKTKMRCISIHDNVADYKYATIAAGYTKLSPVDVVGFIDGIDWDTMEVIIEIDDKFGTKDSPYYISDDEWPLYEFIMRAQYQIDYEKNTSGENEQVATMIRLIGFDLVKIEREGEESK